MSAYLAALLLTMALPQAAAPTPASPPAKVKPVCHSVEVTGSMMSKRICHSADEWKQIDAANQRSTEALRNRTPSRGGGMGS